MSENVSELSRNRLIPLDPSPCKKACEITLIVLATLFVGAGVGVGLYFAHVPIVWNCVGAVGASAVILIAYAIFKKCQKPEVPQASQLLVPEEPLPPPQFQ